MSECIFGKNVLVLLNFHISSTLVLNISLQLWSWLKKTMKYRCLVTFNYVSHLSSEKNFWTPAVKFNMHPPLIQNFQHWNMSLHFRIVLNTIICSQCESTHLSHSSTVHLIKPNIPASVPCYVEIRLFTPSDSSGVCFFHVTGWNNPIRVLWGALSRRLRPPLWKSCRSKLDPH